MNPDGVVIKLPQYFLLEHATPIISFVRLLLTPQTLPLYPTGVEGLLKKSRSYYWTFPIIRLRSLCEHPGVQRGLVAEVGLIVALVKSNL